jgi:hypothetical protein
VVVTLDPAAVPNNLGESFSGLARRLAELYERYGDAELQLLLEFMEDVARRQKDATAELRAGRPPSHAAVPTRWDRAAP